MLDRETIERALRLSDAAPLVVALSGGGDSVALLHLMVEEVGAARLRAVVIDHALRAGSDADARRAAGFAAALGVRAQVVSLDWAAHGPPAPSPASFEPSAANAGEGAGGPWRRSQQDARRARYVALGEAARDHSARVILAAHTRDDQAETIFMRAGAGSGWRGLAGMAAIAPAPVWPEGRGIALARPLLSATREQLRVFLRARGADWIEDPANTNTAFERVRARNALAAMPLAMRFADLASCASSRVRAVDAEAAAILRAARFDADVVELSVAAWTGSNAARARALSLLLCAAAGAEREPGAEAIARLEARLSSDGFRGASLGGARVSRRRGALLFSRDAGAILGRAGGAAPLPEIELLKQREIVWDGRLALTALVNGLRLKPATGAPDVIYKGLALPLDDAVQQRLISASWLQEHHLGHRLGLFSTAKLSKCQYSPATFTRP